MRPSTGSSAFSTGWSQARRTQAGNYGSVRSEVPLKTSAALRSCGRTARWRALRSLKPGGIPSSREGAAWFHFAAGEDQKIGYRAIFLGHRHVLEVDGRRERSFPNDISKFTAWLEEAVRNAVQMVGTGSYQELVERELPIWHRTGTILRRDLWRVFPQWKEEFFQDFSQQEVEEFLTSAVGYPL